MAKRYYPSVQLLRVVLIYLIILHHVILHGTGLIEVLGTKSAFNQEIIPSLIFLGFSAAAPNCFFFISGFFGIHFKTKRFIGLIATAQLYAGLVYVGTALFNKEAVGFGDAIKALFPIPSDIWWFLGVYLMIYAFSGIINRGIESLPANQVFLAIGTIYVFSNIFGYVFSHNTFGANTGLSFVNGLVIYMIGRSMAVHVDVEKRIKKIPFTAIGLLYVFTSLVIGAGTTIGWIKASSVGAFRILDYRNPLLLITAILLVILFLKIDLKRDQQVSGPITVKLSATVIGIYLIHEHYLLRPIIYQQLLQVKSYHQIQPFYILLFYAAAILVVAGMLELARQFIWKKIISFM